MPREVFGPNHAFLPRAEMLSDDEIVRLARAFVRAGVQKIRITGGEPLLRENLSRLIEKIVAIPGAEDVSLTTNGWLLDRQAASLARAGLRRVNVSLDALSDEIFGRMNGRGFAVRQVLAGIEAALAAGFGVKVNMVVQRGMNEEEILPMSRYFRERGIPLRFIEYMDVGNCNGWNAEQVVPAREIVERIAADHPLEPLEPNYRGEVASRYRYVGTENEIGLISSVTEPFCRDCNRARLSADGKLFTCLFATVGTDFRKPLRDGLDNDALFEFVQRVWGTRADRYSEERAEQSANGKHSGKIEMSYIGG